MTTEIDTTCPMCGKHNDRHDAPDGGENTPKDGDYSICIGCGLLGVFDLNAGRVRQPTPDEFREAMDDPDVRRAIRAWNRMDEVREAMRKAWGKK